MQQVFEGPILDPAVNKASFVVQPRTLWTQRLWECAARAKRLFVSFVSFSVSLNASTVFVSVPAFCKIR